MKRTVLHIVSAPASGGAENYVRDLCSALRSRDWKPHIAFISGAGDLGRDAAYETDFLARLDVAGVGYSHIGHECRHKPWLGIARLHKLARRIGADLIHSHLAYGNVFALPLTRTPLVYTHHSEQARFSALTYGLFRRRVAAWIGISRRCAAMLQANCGQPVHLIRNAVDLSRFDGARTRAFERPLKAIAVGRLSNQKNYALLAEALRRIEMNQPHRITVDVFGEGDPDIIRQCSAILAGCRHDLLRFAGASSDISRMMSGRSLFLMSSSWEGMPMALIEATASGLPSIVTDVGGCRELIEECLSGIVVPPNDAAALAAAIETLLSDPVLLGQLSESALRHAPAFAIETAARAHDSLYRQVLS